MAKYSIQQIAAKWIVQNNPEGVKNVLINNGLISANSTLTADQMYEVLRQYFLTNGKEAYSALLAQIPVNENLSASENASLDIAVNELQQSTGVTPVNSEFASVAAIDIKSSAKKFWDLLVGGSSTVVSPTVTTSTKTSPLTIGLIIGGVAILAIIAYVIVKK